MIEYIFNLGPLQKKYMRNIFTLPPLTKLIPIYALDG